jgi:hypothetical protein
MVDVTASASKAERIEALRRRAIGSYDPKWHRFPTPAEAAEALRTLWQIEDEQAEDDLDEADNANGLAEAASRHAGGPVPAARLFLSGNPAAAQTNGQGHQAEVLEPDSLPTWLAGQTEHYRALGTEAGGLVVEVLELLIAEALSLESPGRTIDAPTFIDRRAALCRVIRSPRDWYRVAYLDCTTAGR